MTLLSAPDYRRTVASALRDGWTFASLHATGSSADGVVRTLLVSADGERLLAECAVVDGAVPSLVDLTQAADWDEREAHDLHGIAFAGHEPLRPLVHHPAAVADWTVPVDGHEAHDVAVGPIHAGVIESGHFRFHVVGDRILLLDARLFHKRRGLEEAAVGASLEGGLAYATRACGACWVANAVAYAQACEELTGRTPDAAVARARTILLELERLWSHLNDIGAICAGVGMAAGTQRFAALTGDSRALNERLTGHRFLFGSVVVGGSRLALDHAAVADARDVLGEIRRAGSQAWRELLFNASFMDRMPDIGVVSADDARALGVVGPAARAAGLAIDVRTSSPGLAYDGLRPALLRRRAGDVQARLEQRALELVQILDLLDDLLDEPLAPGETMHAATPAPMGIGRVESPRGATTCLVERDGDHVARLRLRTGSYANWPAVAFAAGGNLLPDFPLINKSFELCYACVDR